MAAELWYPGQGFFLALLLGQPVLDLELHAFGDASTQGVGAAVYAVVRQPSVITQRLAAAKGRLAEQGLTVPHLELTSAHMVTNLMTNF